ncbi:MAG: hypothetical protein KGM42_00175 [Hyphomicrobiales bacterium]|nr:hypothetical protein [Hyphomicrobiales bacterium]
MKATAAEIARILGGRPEGTGYLCRCPVPTHGKRRGDLRPSLGVSDGRNTILFHCFAGCRPLDIISAINKLGFDAFERSVRDRPAPRLPKATRTTSELARKLWRSGRPVAGTPAETYLRARGFVQPPPLTIRFLPSYRYGRETGIRLPSLMAAVQAPSREIVAVELTFLDPSGQRKADVKAPRRAIGPLGQGALRTAPAARHIGLAEGFETSWGASLLHNGLPVWATLGNERFNVIALPEVIKRVTIFADHDAPGLASALSFFNRHPELDADLCWPATAGHDFAQLWLEAVDATKASAVQSLFCLPV